MKTLFALPRQNRLRICSILGVCMLSAATISAQMPAPRVQSEVNSTQMIAVKGSQHPLANPQYDAGRMSSATPINGITLYFSRSAAQQADLDALLAAQQDPSSPQYHQWLTPDQFAARFGMAQSDMDKVQNWLQQQGFSIDSTMRSRTGIRFSGTVAQVESAFQTEMHYYAEGGAKHFAPATALSVPEALAPVVATVRNLNDFQPRPQHIAPRAGFTSAASGNVFFAPGDIATVYDIKPLYSGGIDGAGQTIAIMGQSYIHVSDVEAFQAAAGLTKKDPNLVIVPGTGSDSTISHGDESESDLDVEWSGAIAPGASVDFVYTGSSPNFGVYDSAQYAVDNKIGNIISISYSSCEPLLSTSDLNTLEMIMSQAVAQGQTVMAASGDQGSTACFVENPPQAGDPPLSTQEEVAVNYPASSAYVTGVGGTEINMTTDGASNSTYWASASGSDVLTSAKTWIPEIAWNDDSSQNGLGASGGGASTLVSRPSWQTGVPGIPSGSKRLVPDLAFYSSPNAPGYLYCTSDLPPGQTASCGSGFRASATDNSLTVAGGTSFATPIFAGMVALLNQSGKYVSGSGLINPMLYTLASDSAKYGKAFHDVTSGNNDCTAGSTYCAQTTGFSAGAGYDEVTGLGSLDLAELAAVWPTNTKVSAALIPTSVNVVPANPNPTVSTSDVFTITVASVTGGTTPTGSVTLQIDGGTNYGGTTLTNQALTANGTVTYTANFSSDGTHQVVAQYSGDATHAASTGVGEVSIAVVTSGKGTFALAATNLTVSQGSSGSSTITVTPSGGYTGTINLSFVTSNDTALQNLCYGFTTMQSGGGPDGIVTVTGTTATTTQLTLDTNAGDCATAAAIAATGMHSFKTLHPVSSLRASGGNNAPKPEKNPFPAEIAFGGLLLAGLLGRHSRKLRKLACVIALVAAGFALSACSSTTTNSVPNPPKGTYTITLTGTDSVTSSITANTNFTFTIN